jgi:hypothetical protein
MRQVNHILRCGFIPPLRQRRGFTLVELAVTAVLSVILILTVGIVLIGGQHAWQCKYNIANKKIKQDAEAVMLVFGSVGRKSNRRAFDYSSSPSPVYDSPIYDVIGSVFTPAAKPGISSPVVFGDAVEFRYWDVELDSKDTHDLMDVGKKATAYALFYIEKGKLKVDYGPYPPGAVPLGGGSKNRPDRTVVLAENVTTDGEKGAFSYTDDGTIDRRAAVRINIIITDPEDGEQIKVMTATLMRNEWPR